MPLRTLIIFVLAILTINFAEAQNSSLTRANKYYELYAFDSAIKSYSKVIESEPNNLEALSKLGNACRLTNDMEGAVAYLSKAVTNEGVEPQYILYYAHALKGIGKYETAKKWYGEYAKTDEETAVHYQATCDFAISNKDKKPAIGSSKEYTNTKQADYGPSFLGEHLLFISSQPNQNRLNPVASDISWMGAAYNQLYVSKGLDENGKLIAPTILKDNFQEEFNEGPVAYAKNTASVAYTVNNFKEGIRQISGTGLKLDLFLAKPLKDGTWEKPVPFPYNSASFSNGYPSLSPDGNTMIFASDRPGGMGGFDIYVSYKSGESWSSPENLGPSVNTQGDELTPFVDGNTLYFASNFHPGFGGYDVFQSTVNDNAWSTPVNLGSAVNSTRDDYYFIFDSHKNRGYYASNKEGGRGHEDIYFAKNIRTPLALTVKDNSGNPIPNINVDFSDCGAGVFKTDSKGSIVVYGVKSCKARLTGNGYTTKIINVASSNLTVSLDGAGTTTTASSGFGYSGLVVDENTKLPVKGVLVKHKQKDASKYIHSITDQNGRYVVNMAVEQTYLVKYSRAGYMDTYKTVQAGDGSNQNILGIQLLRRSATGGGDPASLPDAEITNTEAEEGTVVSTKQGGYEIQLGVFRKPDMTKINALGDMGTIETIERADGTKVFRLGRYTTSAEAKSVRDKVENMGFAGAFVRKASVTTVQKKPVEKIVPEDASVDYKIQLGAYKNPDFFEASKYTGMGTIHKVRTSKGVTLFLLGSYGTEAAAKGTITELKSMGLANPFLVAIKDGKIYKPSQLK